MKLTLFFILSLWAFNSVFAGTQNTNFYFNQSNVNAISALACSLHTSLSSESARADETLYFHKFNTLSYYSNSLHVVGFCKSKTVNAKNNFELKALKENTLVGYVDNYKFYIYFESIKRVYKNRVRNFFVLKKITMFPSPSILPDALAKFLEPSFEKISVQKIIPYKAKWLLNEGDAIEFKSDEFNKSLLGFVLYQNNNSLLLDAVPSISFHNGQYRRESEKAQAVFLSLNSKTMYGCSQFTDSTESDYKISPSVCYSLWKK